jgi:hypothetical protein
MSRSNQTEIKNPALHFLQWKGEKSIKKVEGKIIETDKHCFVYYNKEKKENIEIPMPVTFIVLDTLHTIKGYNESEGQGYYSNEIRSKDFKIAPFRVKCGKNDAAEGLYADIMPTLKSNGAKYCQIVYVLMKEGEEWVINNIQIQGAALGPWIDFCKNANVMKIAVKVDEWVEETKGTNTFNIPVFKACPVSESTNQVAVDMDKELQDYLTKYFTRNSNDEAGHKAAEEFLDTEDLPTIAEQKRLAAEYEARQPKADYATDLPF